MTAGWSRRWCVRWGGQRRRGLRLEDFADGPTSVSGLLGHGYWGGSHLRSYLRIYDGCGMVLVDDLLYWRRHPLASHLLGNVRRQILMAGSHGPTLQRAVQLRGHPRPVNAEIRSRRWRWGGWRGALYVLDEPLQVVPRHARLDGHVMQMILEVPLIYDAPLVGLERVLERRLYPLEQWT